MAATRIIARRARGATTGRRGAEPACAGALYLPDGFRTLPGREQIHEASMARLS